MPDQQDKQERRGVQAPESMALPLSAEGEIIRDRNGAEIDAVCGLDTSVEEDYAHAAFLAHAANCYGGMLAALEELLTSCAGAYKAGRINAESYLTARAAFARATEAGS